LNPTSTTPPCYNNMTLGNRLYAQHKDPNVTNPICWTCENCSYKCAADCEHCCQRPQCLPGRGYHYESACYCDRQSVFLGAATDTKCMAFPTTPRLADLDSSTGGQQGRLLQLGYCNSVLAGAPGHLRKREHITPLLHELHWLRVPERIKFRLCVLAYRCLHSTVPSYLAESLQLSTDIAARRHLRSAASPTLLVPSSSRSTLGDRSFPVAASRAWNSLPAAVRDTPSLLCFRRRLKTALFQWSFDC